MRGRFGVISIRRVLVCFSDVVVSCADVGSHFGAVSYSTVLKDGSGN